MIDRSRSQTLGPARRWLRHCCGALLLGAAPLASAGIADLGWLAGCWQHERGEPGTIELWSAPAGRTMFGVSRWIRDGDTRSWEYLRIVEGADGALSYVAEPSGQRPTSFALARLAQNEAVFENPLHDFPQRITYRRDGERLHARIEGEVNGEVRGVDFPMRRCAERVD